MKTLHTIQNCNYRKFLYKQLKHGKISGQFYRFLCKNFPYRLTCRAIDMNVRKVMHGKINESTAINTLKEKEKELNNIQDSLLEDYSLIAHENNLTVKTVIFDFSNPIFLGYLSHGLD